MQKSMIILNLDLSRTGTGSTGGTSAGTGAWTWSPSIRPASSRCSRISWTKVMSEREREVESSFYSESWPWLELGSCPFMHNRSLASTTL